MNRMQQLAKISIEAVESDDLDAAVAVARQKAQEDPELLVALQDWAIRAWINAEWRSGRAARWYAPVQEASTEDTAVLPPTYGPTPPSPSLIAGMNHAIADVKRRLMEYEMEPGSGRRLGDCTKPEIEKYAHKLKANANTLSLRSAWLMAVAGMMPDNKKIVKEVLREQDLTRLQRRVERQEAA